jgi:simple sugar transport system substrate-binding protein
MSGVLKVLSKPRRLARVGGVFCLVGTVALTLASASAGSPSGKKANLKVGVIEIYPSPFYVDLVKGVHKVADPAHVQVLVRDTNADPAAQTKFVQDFITAGVSAIILSATTPSGSITDAQRIQKAGIPLICADSCASANVAPKYVKVWATSNQTTLGSGAGKTAVQYIKSQLGGKATIGMVVCDSLGPVCTQRTQAFKQSLKAVPGAKVVATEDAYETDKATPIIVSMLTAKPDINVLLTDNQGSTEGAVAAVRQLHLAGKVAVFGIDITTVIATDMLTSKPPILRYTIGQDSYTEGIVAMTAALNAMQHKPTGQFKRWIAPLPFTYTNPGPLRQWVKTGGA